MIRVHASHAKSSLSQTNSGSATPPASVPANSALAFSPPHQPRQLRYDAYAPPSASMVASLVSARSGRMPGDDRSRSTSRARAGRDRDGGGGGGGVYSDSPFRTSPSISAGDFALLEAEATESADMDPHSRSKHEVSGDLDTPSNETLWDGRRRQARRWRYELGAGRLVFVTCAAG
jgi:hypothetical protein